MCCPAGATRGAGPAEQERARRRRRAQRLGALASRTHAARAPATRPVDNQHDAQRRMHRRRAR